MPVYHVYRLKESVRQQFRWQPHTGGVSTVKPRDYQKEQSIEAPSPYAAWQHSRTTDQPLQVGDILEAPDGTLSICKYIGFEEARWFVPEAAPVLNEVL